MLSRIRRVGYEGRQSLSCQGCATAKSKTSGAAAYTFTATTPDASTATRSSAAHSRVKTIHAASRRHGLSAHQRPAAAEAARRLEQLSQQTHYRGTVITDQRRLRRLMARDDPAIYPDKYVTCAHTHATALCQQRHDQRGTLRPDIGSCKPLCCRNVALTADNIDNLRTEITHIDGRP